MTFRKHLSALATLAAMVSFTTAAEATTVMAQKGNLCSATWNTGAGRSECQCPNADEALDAHVQDGDPACDVDGAQATSAGPGIRMRPDAEALVCTPEQLSALKLTGPAKKAKVGCPS